MAKPTGETPLNKILRYPDVPGYLRGVGEGIEASGEALHTARMHLSLMLSDQRDRATITAADWPEAHKLYDDIEDILDRLRALLPASVLEHIETATGHEMELEFETWCL